MEEPTQTIQYEIPAEVDTTLGLDETNAAIAKENGDMAADPNHPCWKKNHPQNKQYMKRRTERFEHRANLQAELPDDFEKATQERADKNQRKQTQRIQLAEIEMKKLGKLGFSTAEIPDDISDIQIELLRAEGHYKKGDLLLGDQICRDVSKKMKLSSTKLEGIFGLRDMAESEEDRKSQSDQIVLFLNKEHKKQRATLEKQQIEIQNKIDNPTDRFKYL